MEAYIRPRRSHSNSFGNDAEKDTAGCRALNRKYIVIGGVDDIEDSEDNSEASECDDFFDEEQQDEFEFDDVDPEIFRDPTLMVKWLNSMDNNSD